MTAKRHALRQWMIENVSRAILGVMVSGLVGAATVLMTLPRDTRANATMLAQHEQKLEALPAMHEDIAVIRTQIVEINKKLDEVLEIRAKR